MMVATFFVVLAISLLVAFFANKRSEQHSKRQTVELILVALLVANGVMLIFGGFTHIINPSFVAKDIGWPTSTRFQFEVGIANIAIGVVLVGCLRKRQDWMLAAIVASSIWIFGDGIGHIISHQDTGNSDPGNWGIALNVVYAANAVAIALYVWLRVLRSREQKAAV